MSGRQDSNHYGRILYTSLQDAGAKRRQSWSVERSELILMAKRRQSWSVERSELILMGGLIGKYSIVIKLD